MKCGSQVFACKMCHFLLPNLFLVIDNWATGVMDYEFCWRGMKLDKYSWAQLCPLAVHPEFRMPVWHEVNRRLKGCPQSVPSDELERGQWLEVAKRRIEDWRQLCGTEG